MTSLAPLTLPSGSIALRAAILLSVVAIPLGLLMLGLDRRVLDDEALWLEPLKFHLSLAMHGVTVLLAVRLLPEAWQAHPVARGGLAFFAVVIVYEAAFLSIQAGRGVRSHFNDATPFDAIGGTVMAAGAGVLVAVPFVLGLALAAAVLRGGWSGIAENPLPLAAMLGCVLAGWLGAQTGSAMGANGGPFVGVDPAQGPFVPLTGWSLAGGDYRISHFLGVHAMQALPLAALALLAVLPAGAVAWTLPPIAAGWAGLTLLALARAGEGLPPF